MQCPRCQQENPSHAKFCLACGTPLKLAKKDDLPEASYADLQRDLTDAREQQTATSEILRVISSSPTDLRPVFNTIVQSGLRLLGGYSAVMLLVQDDQFHLAAYTSTGTQGDDSVTRLFPIPMQEQPQVWRAVLEKRPVVVEDAETEPGFTESMREMIRARGWRSSLQMPMMRDNNVIGLLNITRQDPGSFASDEIALLGTFGAQAVIAIENVRLFNELEARNADLTEALMRETATGEILRVIAGSPTELQPVLDAVVARAALVCAARDAVLYRGANDELEITAHVGPIRATPGFRFPLDRGTLAGRAFLDRAPIHVRDLAAEHGEFPRGVEFARTLGTRTCLAVPLVRQGTVLGVLSVRRDEVQAFSDAQIVLLQTFADQAVIAIENVRLFTELQEKNRALTQAHAQVSESLEQQTATAEILRVISSSPTDVQPVFAAIVRSAVRLCGGTISTLYRYDGHLIHFEVTSHPSGIPQAITRGQFPRPADVSSLIGRAIVERAVVNVADMGTDPRANPGIGRVAARERGFRSMVIVPMFRENQVIGIITVGRAEPGEFSDSDIALLKTFADQAVIAIENVRLFTELEARNRELTTALDTQTATSDILRVMSHAQTDVRPVFDAILASAVRLLQGYSGVVTRVAGDQLDLAALTRTTDAGDAAVRALYPERLDSQATHVRATRNRAPLNIADAHSDPQLPEVEHTRARVRGYRSHVVVPLLRQDEAIGTIGVTRRDPGGFTDDEIALLQTFADQAVIAIENVRLFKELEERNRDLTATSELLRVISRSPTDAQPVFDAIVDSAARLTGAQIAAVLRFDGELYHYLAGFSPVAGADEEYKRAFPRPLAPDVPSARAIRERCVIRIPDIELDNTIPDGTRQRLRLAGVRSNVQVPMLRDDVAIGVIAVSRTQPIPFTDRQVALLQTFADQAVIAIENVRLFTELQEKNRALTQAHAQVTEALDQQTATSEILRVISRSPSDVQPVFDAIVESARRLLNGFSAIVTRVVGDELHLSAFTRTTEAGDAFMKSAFPMPLAHGSLPVNIADAQTDPRVPEAVRANARARGYRSQVVVPLLRHDEAVGTIAVTRREPGGFTDDEIALLKTFADQAVIAIENVRLFKELEAANHELAAASQHKSEFLANMSHELRTPLNAIIGFSEVLSEKMFGELNEKQEEYSKDIHASGQHLLSLINDILDLSKIEAGRMELELTDFHLPTALDNALTLVRERAGRRGITLQTSIDEQLGEVRADERKIRQVVLNLLSNAIKFTPEGGRIEVGALPRDGSVEVSVSDTGVGIALEDQEAVFEEFRQVGTAEKKSEGTGLGLTLCRKFIELHGGRIWVKSQVSVGSTFAFTIPVLRGE